jgi:hypothetical protein
MDNKEEDDVEYDDNDDDNAWEVVVTADMIDPDTGIVIDQHEYHDDEDDEDDTSNNKNTKSTTPHDMRTFLYSCEGVFLDELPEPTSTSSTSLSFMFDIEKKTNVISSLLEANPDTLQITFSQLTDQVEYAEFWKRFFYRLDYFDVDVDKQESSSSSSQRLQETYDYYYQQKQQEQAAAAAATTYYQNSHNNGTSKRGRWRVGK